jgi:hypothetical protein
MVTFLLVGVFCWISCGEEDDPITAVPPVFSATPVDIAYDPSDSSFGDIMFESPVLTPFGDTIQGDSLHYAAYIEYYTVPDAPVRAVTRGVVDTIIENPPEQGDYEVRVVSLPGANYTVVYDHVVNLLVLQSSPVNPGDTIGRAGTWDERMRRTQLTVTVGEGTDRRAYCPLNFGDSSFNEQHQSLLAEYNLRGFTPPYDSLCLLGSVRP